MRQDAMGTKWGRLGGGLLMVLLLAGCDRTPMDVGAEGSELESVAVQEVWELLASTAGLEVRALNRLETNPASGEAAATLLDAAELSLQAAEARSSGADGEAEALDDTLEFLLTRGLMISLGSEAARITLEETETALRRLRASLSEGGSPATHAVLVDAEGELAAARAAQAAGDVGETLMASARASESARTLDPEANAKAAVAEAWELLEKAQRMAGPSPEPVIARALEQAEGHCMDARRALDAQRWRAAVRSARACARLSRAVIARLSGGVDEDALAERAQQAVAHAGALLQRATEKAGDDPRPRIQELLDEAGDFLLRARNALNEERFRAAIQYAGQSGARSLRVLTLLEGSDTDPMELRAKAAVEVAQQLLNRAEQLLSPDTPAEFRQMVERGSALLQEARVALARSDWRGAITKAREASGLLMRVIQALS